MSAFLIPTRIFFVALLATSVLIASCGGGQKPTEEEAYQVGFDLGIVDRCGPPNRRNQPMPAAYDDSLGSGKLEAAFSDGYNDAHAVQNPCRDR